MYVVTQLAGERMKSLAKGSTLLSNLLSQQLHSITIIILFQMQIIALRILPLVHNLQEQFCSFFSVRGKSRLRLRTGESHLLHLFPVL